MNWDETSIRNVLMTKKRHKCDQNLHITKFDLKFLFFLISRTRSKQPNSTHVLGKRFSLKYLHNFAYFYFTLLQYQKYSKWRWYVIYCYCPSLQIAQCKEETKSFFVCQKLSLIMRDRDKSVFWVSSLGITLKALKTFSELVFQLLLTPCFFLWSLKISQWHQ